MNLQKIPLKTVRQFFIQDVVLADFEELFTPDTPQVTKKMEDLCYAKVTLEVLINPTARLLILPAQPCLVPSFILPCCQVSEMLDEAERERLGCPLTPEKPLIRLRVRWTRL